MFRHYYPLPAGMPLLRWMLSPPAAGVRMIFPFSWGLTDLIFPWQDRLYPEALIKGDDGAWEFLQDDGESFISKRSSTNLAGPSLVPPSGHEKTSHVPRDILCPQIILLSLARSQNCRSWIFSQSKETCRRNKRHSELQVFRSSPGWMKNQLSQFTDPQSTAKFFDWIWLWTKVHDRGQRFPISILK